MNISQLITDLQPLGNIEYCNYNTVEELNFIISISGFNSTINNINQLNHILNTQVIPTFPVIHHYGINDDVVKIDLGK